MSITFVLTDAHFVTRNCSPAEEGSSDLLKVTISLIPPVVCNRTFTGGTKDDRLQFGIIGDWQVCAGEFGKDTCQVIILNRTNLLINDKY